MKEPHSANEPVERFLDVQGRKVFCVSAGQGAPVLLLHGIGASTYTWRFVLRALAAHHQVHAIDWIGYGRSDKPWDFDYSPGGYSRLLGDVLDALGLDRADLVGNSLGGLISLMTAMDHPERVGKIALLGTPAYLEDRPLLLWPLRWPLIGKLYEWSLGPWTVSLAASQVYVNQTLVTPELLENYSASLRVPEGRHAVAALFRNILPPDAEERIRRYRELQSPVLVLCGDKDNVVKRSSVERLASELPNGTLRIIPACGHAPQEDRPEETLSVLLDFLRQS